MPINNDALKQQLANRAAATSSGHGNAAGGAPPAGGPQGVFDVSNDGVTWAPAVRLRAGAGTSFVTINGVSTVTASVPGSLEFPTQADFRASAPPADGTVYRIVSPPGEFRYSTTSGTGWADDGDTILKPDSVALGSPGRGFTTRASAHAATFTAARAMKGLLVSGIKHVHVESHTVFGDGGAGTFDVKDNSGSTYTDDNGTVIAAGTAALVRRGRFAERVNAKWWGGRGDWDPNTDTGGELDNAAIVAAVAFATTNKLTAYIPAGTKCWVIDSTRVHVDHNTRIVGDGWMRTNIATKLSAGIYVGAGAYGSSVTDFIYNWELKDFSIVYFGGSNSSVATIDCLIDIVASAQGKIWEVGVGGRVKHGVQSVRTAPWPADVRGENYFLHTMLRTARPVIGAMYPLRYDWMIRNYGALNGATISGHCQLPLVGGASIGGESGDEGDPTWGSNVRIKDFHVESDNSPATIGIRALSILGLTIDHVYGEGIGTILDLTQCHLVHFQNTYGGTNYIRQCRGVTAGPNYAHTEWLGCTGVTELTGGSFSPDAKAIGMDNVAVVTLGHGNEAGINGAYPVVGFVQTDPVNLAVNGDFTRWINVTTPWGWKPLSGYSMNMTKCGVGLSDTTHSRGASYCARLNAGSIIFLPLTGPLGKQYLNTTISVSIKAKITASYLAAMITHGTVQRTDASRNLSLANTWIPCLDEDAGDDWRLCTFSFVVTEDMCTYGATLQINTIPDTVAYISELMASFGVACPRSFVRARETFGGAVQILDGGRIRIVSGSSPGSADPWANQAYLEGDTASSTLIGTVGWLRDSAGTWQEVGRSDASQLFKRIVAATGSKLTRGVIGEDLPESGSIDSWPARSGAACAATSTGRATLGTLRGRKAAIFSGSTNPHGYAFETGSAEYWAVARWDDSLPFASYVGLIGGAQTAGVGQRLIGNSGNSTMFEFGGTVERDGAHTLTIEQGASHIWRTYGTAGSDTREIGCSSTNVLGNWQGSIACCLAFSSTLTTEEAATVLALLRAYYSI